MSAVYPTLPKLAVRDGFDEDDLTDIDDEVFIRDGKNGSLKLDDDGGVKRPLMAPRRKCKRSCNFERHRFPYRALLVPFCYGIMALVVLLGLIVLCIFTANIFPMPLTILRTWLSHELKDTFNDSDIVPCTSLASQVLWTRTLPTFTSESHLRSNDVNDDGVEDIIVGFSAGLETMDTPEYICGLDFDGQIPCVGGVLALNGNTGETLWTHWTAHPISSVDCGLDLTDDKTKDCVISGRGGVIHAINGRDGSSIWEMPTEDLSALNTQRVLDVYDAKFIADIDGDEIGDIIASHGIQSGGIRSNEILIISGITGNIIHSAKLPDTEEIFLAPQMLVHPDGESLFILVTSSQTQSGGLYVVPQVNLMYGDLKLRKLHHDTGKGALLPPILVDITLDAVEDIVAAMFNSTIIAYDGLTFQPIWNYTVPNSEVISTPIPGYYNDDNVPDFMVKHQIGAGFPTYYYTVATIIDGKTGKPLLEKPIEDSLSRQLSGLSVTVDGFGNDWFLHWSVDCVNYEGVKENCQYLKGESLVSDTRAGLCKMRLNSTLTTNLFALSQHVGPPGISLHYSEDWKSVEFNNTLNQKLDSYPDMPFVSERSPKTRKSHHKSSAFKEVAFDAPPIENKDNSDSAFQNYNYKERKRLPESDLQNANSDVFNNDYSWRNNANKWAQENMPSNKDYDMTYDINDNSVNIGDDQNIEYPLIDEIREQRSDDIDDIIDLESVEHDFSKQIESILNNSNDTKTYDSNEIEVTGQINDYLINPRINVSLPRRRKRDVNFQQENITNSTNSFEDVDAGFLINSDQITEENDTLNGTTTTDSIKFEVSTSMFNTINSTITIGDQNNTLNYTETNYIDENATEIFQEIEEHPQIYRPNFLNTKEDQEEDANIEQIFKRESLKNRYGERNEKNLDSISAKWANKYNKKLKRQKRKRDTSSENIRPRFHGIQKQPPTGILLPSISKSNGKTAVDLVFSTYWLPSSGISVILLPEDLDCIHRKKTVAANKVQYKGNDDIIEECLTERGVNYNVYQETMDRDKLKVSLGQMTIYRIKLECVCPEDMLPNQSCKNISLRQSWPEHLGSRGNGYFKPLVKPNAGKGSN